MTAATQSAFVYLASASPRRRELLACIGVDCEILPASVDESLRPEEDPRDYVRRLARTKAREAWRRRPPQRQAPVLAADTAVVVGGTVLGKPADQADASRMLEMLSGRVHDVYTAVAVISEHGDNVALSRTQVSFRVLSPAEIAAYWRSGEPADKAGAYAIQGLGAIFVRRIRGSYSGVVGLPLFETAELLATHRVSLLRYQGER